MHAVIRALLADSNEGPATGTFSSECVRHGFRQRLSRPFFYGAALSGDWEYYLRLLLLKRSLVNPTRSTSRLGTANYAHCWSRQSGSSTQMGVKKMSSDDELTTTSRMPGSCRPPYRADRANVAMQCSKSERGCIERHSADLFFVTCLFFEWSRALQGPTELK